MADEIRSELTFEAQQAINTLNRMEAELNQYNQAVAAAAAGTSAFNAAGSRFDRSAAGVANSLSKLGTAATTASKQLRTVSDAQNQAAIAKFNALFETSRDRIKRASDDVVKSFRKQEKGAEALGNTLVKTGKQGEKAGKQVLLSWQSVARIFAIQTIHRAISLVTDAFAGGISDAADYQKQLSEIQTIGDDLNLTLGELDDQVRQISDAFGQYQTLSNQVGEAGDAFNFLISANKLATAAVATTDDAVNLLSSAINSFNLNTEDADDIGAKFFKTIELGRVRAGELANTFGRVGVLSNQLGVSFDETLASIASLTVQGLRFNEAFTLITNTQLKLIRPTDNLKKAFQELGIDSAEAGIQAFGFQGLLQKLADTTGGTATEMGDLFNRVRAIRGVLGLTGDAAANFQKVLKEIKEASGEVELTGAFAEVFDTDAARFKRELTALRNFFVADFGQTAISAIVNIGGAFGGLADAVKALALGIGAATVAFGTYIAITVAATFSMGTFVPLGAIIAIGVAVAGAALAYDALTTSVREANEARLREADTALRAEVREERVRRALLKQNEDAILSDIQVFLQKRQAAFREDAKVALRIQTQLLDQIKDQVEDRFVGSLEESVRDATQSLRELNGELQQVGDDLEQFNFDRSIRGLNDSQKVTAQIQRSQEAIRASNDALAKGDTERAERLAAIARQAANAALSTADSASNAALVRRAEEQVRESIRAKADIIKDTIADREKEASIAQGLLGQETARLTRIKAIAAEIAKLEAISDGLEVNPEFSPEAAKKQAEQLTRLLEKELQGAAKSADLLSDLSVDFESIREDLRQKFREPLTGVEIDLTDAVQINLERIIQKLNQQASQLTTGQTAALASLGVDTDELFRGFGEAQKLITEIPKEIQRGVESTKTLTVNAVELNKAFIDVDQSVEDVVSKLERAQRLAFPGLGELEGFTGTAQAALGATGALLRDIIPGLDSVRGGAQNLSTVLRGLVFDFRAAFAAGDPEGIKAAIDGVNLVSKQLAEQGLAQSSKQVAELSKNLERAAEEASEVRIGENAAASLRPLEERIQAVDGAFDEQGKAATDAGTAGQQAGNIQTTAQGGLKSAVDLTNQALQQQLDLQNQLGTQGGGQPGRQFGGLMFRADGGMIFDRRQFGGQRGTDSIPTMLTAGESVNTLEATRRFFPQIQAMNAGVMPQFREEGGVVNNTVGDISINVTEAASGRDTAREVMKQIKREFRRNPRSVRLNALSAIAIRNEPYVRKERLLVDRDTPRATCTFGARTVCSHSPVDSLWNTSARARRSLNTP
jgi:TP901 family phage tail tape measure protein